MGNEYAQEQQRADMLMNFADLLFYNFRTDEVAQKAMEHIADALSICRVTVLKAARAEAPKVAVLYDTGAVIDENAHIEEKTLQSIYGSAYSYRIYRCSEAAPLDMMQRRMLDYVFKTLHTYLNRQAAMDMAKFARTHDMAFRCLNANGMSEILRSKQEHALDFSKYAVAFMNVQKFKAINARYGFENGNRIMQQIVEHFRRILSEDEQFAHIGGDNFSVFLRRDGLEQKFEQFNTMSCQISHEGRAHEVPVSFRIGAYRIEPYVQDVAVMLEKASIAFSIARQSGQRNIIFYNTDERRKYEYRKHLEQAIEPSLRAGEFMVYFQPKTELATFEITGAEALTRWKHEDEMIPPDQFIPLFEHCNKIADLDMFVFDTVCRSLRCWMDAGIKPVTVSVNFSRLTLETPDFAATLRRIASRYDVPTEYLEVEFTESLCMENEPRFRDILAELKAAGFCTSLDDFGKGYSSLNMLKNMEFDVLKLDKCFLSGEDDTDDDREYIILESIIRMVQSLRMQVIAEGVEKSEQVDLLRKLGCTKAQGYYFDRPLPEEQFLERLRKGKYEFEQMENRT